MIARIDTRFNEELFFRVSKSDVEPFSMNLMAAEIILNSNVRSSKRDILSLVFQVYVLGTMRGWAKAMHQGNAYIIVPTGLGKPSIKLGQQVIPFGLLAWYDTHGKVFQNPYSLAIGERIDAGITVQGILGPVDWWYMISNGNGPNVKDPDDNKVQTARFALDHSIGLIDMRVGFSILRGVLPEFTQDPLAIMMVEPDSLIMKNRVCIDGEFTYTYFNIIYEVIYGIQGSLVSMFNNMEQGAIGGYIEVHVPLSYSIELKGMYSRWQPRIDQPLSHNVWGAGVRIVPETFSMMTLQVMGLIRDEPMRKSKGVIAQVNVSL